MPLVLIPTTAGTGAEVSGASVLTDKRHGRKHVIAGPRARATYALVDPLLTVGLPPAPTSHTGIDALAQAIGGTIVLDGNPLSIAVGLEAVRHLARALPRAVADGSDLEARREQALGSLLAGLAMNLSDCSADHSLGQADRQPAAACRTASRSASCWRRPSTSAAATAPTAWSAWPTRSASPPAARPTGHARRARRAPRAARGRRSRPGARRGCGPSTSTT